MTQSLMEISPSGFLEKGHDFARREGLDTLLITACDITESNQPEDVELLIKITQDRGELLRAMRQNYIAEKSSLTPAGRQLFLRITGFV